MPDTPLGLACGRSGHTICITSLLSGGAHIDFRGASGLTPMHRAAIGGNAQAIMVRDLACSGGITALTVLLRIA